jgi:hypothetical protein
VRITLDERDGSGSRTVPVIAYTLVPGLSVRGPGGGLVSALVLILLSQGFTLCLSIGYADILLQAEDVKSSFGCTIMPQGLLTLHLEGERMYLQQFSPSHPDDAGWLEAARAGAVLVISGDNLNFTDTWPDFEAAARLDTLVAGRVCVGA